MSIFLLLLDAHLGALKKAGLPMILAFGLGALGTVSGVMGAAWLTGASSWLGDLAAPFTGMFVATYVGGSANFNALALHYDVVSSGALFAGANAVDNTVTAIWMGALLVLPALLRAWLPARTPVQVFEAPADAESAQLGTEASRPDLMSLAALLALAFSAHALSLYLAGLLAQAGLAVPSILILTTLALLAAQLPMVRRLDGAQLLGTYGAYLFLAVIGALCDFSALLALGELGLQLVAFVGLVIPHLFRLFFGSDHRVLVPACIFGGGAYLVLCDLLARTLPRQGEMPAGVITALIGAPVFIFLLKRSRQ